MNVTIKTPQELEYMKEAGRLAAEVLDMIEPHVQAGISTEALDRLCYEHITAVQKCIPACLGYGEPPYPASTCISVNHVICHGIPSQKKLKKGDIVNIDVTVIEPHGFHGDTSRMYVVGECGVRAQKLVDAAYEAMWRGIEIVRPGTTLGDIGHIIQSYAEGLGFSVVREFCGHGIGRVFHEDPQVLHYGRPGKGLVLEEGMTFTIEPMINAGARGLKILPDGWTVVTRDHSLSAQWEHTLAVTRDGYEVYTLSARERQAGGKCPS